MFVGVVAFVLVVGVVRGWHERFHALLQERDMKVGLGL